MTTVWRKRRPLIGVGVVAGGGAAGGGRPGTRRAAPLERDGHARLAPRGRDHDRPREPRHRKQAPEQRRDHAGFLRTPRASSRSATRRFRSSRLSCSFLALASAITTLAIPSLKYSSSGTSVSPLRLVPPISLRISCAWSSSLRGRAGGGVV